VRKQSAKTKRILAYMEKNPDAKASDIAQKYGVHVSRVYQLRKKAESPEPVPEVKKGGFDIEKFRLTPEKLAEINKKLTPPQATIAKKLNLTADQYLSATSVDTVLDTRAQDYGAFKDGAQLMQGLKRLMADHAQRHNKTFADDQWEALEMIIHKVGRIVNGNPDKVDHWTDIAGYAKLVADRLEGRVR